MSTTHNAAGVPYSRPLTVGIRSTLGYLLFVIMVLTMIDGIIPQAEIALFSGHILLPTVVLKYLFIGTSIFGLVATARASTSERLFMPWLIIVAYLLVELFIFRVAYGYSLIYIVYSFEATLYFLLLLPFIYAFRKSVDERRITKLIIFLFISLAVVGFLQFITNKPILPTESSDHFFEVFSWDFYGHVRAFSFFSSASNFGHYLALMAAMSVAIIATQKGRHRVVGAFMLLLSIVATYMTLTRATYVEVSLAILTAILITFFKWRGSRLSMLWIVYAGLGLFIAFLAPVIVAGIKGNGDLLADASLLLRFHEWSHYLHILSSHGLVALLFGTGLIQSNRFPLTKHIVIDNVWLSLAFQLGLIGFLVVTAFLWKLWKLLLRGLDLHSNSVLTIGVVSACSTFPFTSIFGITTLSYVALIVI